MKNFITSILAVVVAMVWAVTPVMAADDANNAITNKRIIDTAPRLFSENKAVLIGVTDDASNFLKLLRATDGGYMITSATPSATSFVNVTAAADTDICQAGCIVYRVIIGVGDAATSVALYDDADGTCTSDLITTIDTATAGVVSIGLITSTGLCMTSTGHDTGNVTVVYK